VHKVYGGHYPEHPKEDTDDEYKQVGHHQSLIKHTIVFFSNDTTFFLVIKNVI
jgi:hypothetical protein